MERRELGKIVPVLIFLCLAICVSVCQSGRISNMRNRLKKINTPYVTFYANEYHRGGQYVETLMHGCKDLPDAYSNWASSVNTHNRCVDVCTLKNCEGKCTRIYPSSGVNTDSSLKLALIEMNDRISSVKSCYTLMSRRG